MAMKNQGAREFAQELKEEPRFRVDEDHGKFARNGAGYESFVLVNTEELLEILWPSEKSRPTQRWLKRLQANGVLSYYKCNGLVFWNPSETAMEVRKLFRVPRK